MFFHFSPISVGQFSDEALKYANCLQDGSAMRCKKQRLSAIRCSAPSKPSASAAEKTGSVSS
ncbi:hypothetical protein BN2476_750101 [Paraburkholderia piptadeniae]|uniref:Uncharacterized protein n=1 Tax=Paraburkholderia piptadeniae TaxID=1701573 RepID=A0A1N7SRY8_9BURK|nr:hypothetical protein BN2476_750101 [Paraburkholderia piptadeniae]